MSGDLNMKTFKEGLLMLLLCSTLLSAQSSEEVREAEVAGMFYPGKANDLKNMLNGYLTKTEKVVEGDILGLVSPHAGYVYSGPVAAWSYKQIEGNTYDVVVVIAPSHFEYFPGSSIFTGKYYETPLGKIPIDQELAKKLADASPDIHLSTRGHYPGPDGRGEHSLEVQLPFLQNALSEFQLIPIVIADQSWENTQNLGDALATELKDKKALMVASSDLSHYHSYDEAYKLDEALIDFFTDFEFQKILQGCENRHLEACGSGPIAVMMYVCSKMGYNKSKVLKYATSGDVPIGEKSQVVGYLSGAVYK
jgi:AmmeMemoRadiSam system protein B